MNTANRSAIVGSGPVSSDGSYRVVLIYGKLSIRGHSSKKFPERGNMEAAGRRPHGQAARAAVKVDIAPSTPSTDVYMKIQTHVHIIIATS